ncbi:MAG TPA: glycosyltransferase [Longimicrobiaceae bacterium]|nr:glycosyltransferase [Longimicrobiaceae bacterium]
MEPAPLVSIVLITHDRLAYLREAVASVLAQTLAAWELIVLDDGSTDGSAEWVRSLADGRVRLEARPHRGRVAALRNEGVRLARGRWVAFLDSDDAWREDKLAAQVAAHRARPEVRWSYTGRTVVDAAGAVIPDARLAPFRPLAGWISRELLVHEAKVSLPTVMAERALLEEAGGFDESLPYATDYDLWLRLAVRAECLVLPEPLTRIRVHPASFTHDRPAVNASFVAVYRKFARANPAPEVRRTCRRQEAFYAVHLARQRFRRGERLAGVRAVAFALARRPFYRPAWEVLARGVFRGEAARPPAAPPPRG